MSLQAQPGAPGSRSGNLRAPPNPSKPGQNPAPIAARPNAAVSKQYSADARPAPAPLRQPTSHTEPDSAARPDARPSPGKAPAAGSAAPIDPPSTFARAKPPSPAVDQSRSHGIASADPPPPSYPPQPIPKNAVQPLPPYALGQPASIRGAVSGAASPSHSDANRSSSSTGGQAARSSRSKSVQPAPSPSGAAPKQTTGGEAGELNRPPSSRARPFDSPSDFVPLPAGLINLGNTCYMNSVLQCLFRVKPLADFVVGPDFDRNLNMRNPLGSHGQVAREFRGVVRELRNLRGAVQPTGFKRALGMHSQLFSDRGQHDAHECLVTILDAIHEDLNQSPRALGERINRSELSGMALHNATNRSEVSKLFHGASQTRIRFSCGGSEILEEPLVFWSLPLPAGSSLDLEQCINSWRETEVLSDDNQFYCNTCNKLENITRTSEVIKFAPFLVVQLKRFKETPWGMRKNGAPVKYPTVIDSARYAAQATGLYRLLGVVCHSGTLDGGHYTCVVKDPDRRKWYDISDSHVRECSERDASQAGAYILFYENRS